MKRHNARRKQWDKLQRKAFQHHKWARKFVVSKLQHDALKLTSWWGKHYRY
jgi:hypothetical protein